jgi:phenylacetaldehyde dehydrogenase
VFDPATGERIATVADGNAQEVDQAVAAARRAFEGVWSSMRPADREMALHRFANAIEAHTEELAQIETLNQGKSINLARAIEVGGSVEYVRYMAGWATKIEGSTLDLSIAVPPGVRHTGLVLREPVGVVGGIIPWNFPLMIAVQKIAPALACGCTVVLKPSEVTPLTALRLAELALEAGIPPGVVNVVTGRGATAGTALASHPGINKLSFTGSTVTGRKIGVAALEHFTRFTLELGGKNPMIVLGDVDVGAMLPGIMAGCFFNQGQVCAAASRLYIDEKVFDSTVERLIAAMTDMTMGPGLDPAAELQPLVSARHRAKVADVVRQAQEAGANILTGGKCAERPGWFFEPTLLVEASESNPAMTTEIFGPVIAATRVSGLDEALTAANATPYGLAASVWTNDLSSALKAIRQLKAGTVWVNSHIPIDPNLPFGGHKQSGIGREHGRSMIDLYTELKSVVISGL